MDPDATTEVPDAYLSGSVRTHVATGTKMVGVRAQQLKTILDAVVVALEAEKSLPEQMLVKPTEKVKNPFG